MPDRLIIIRLIPGRLSLTWVPLRWPGSSLHPLVSESEVLGPSRWRAQQPNTPHGRAVSADVPTIRPTAQRWLLLLNPKPLLEPSPISQPAADPSAGPPSCSGRPLHDLKSTHPHPPHSAPIIYSVHWPTTDTQTKPKQTKVSPSVRPSNVLSSRQSLTD